MTNTQNPTAQKTPDLAGALASKDAAIRPAAANAPSQELHAQKIAGTCSTDKTADAGTGTCTADKSSDKSSCGTK
jgi:hypothetical protein